MKIKLLPFFSLTIILSFFSVVSAQYNFADNQSGVATVGDSSDTVANLTRPRRVLITKTNPPAPSNVKNSFAARDLEEQVFQLLNNQRAEKQLSSLEWSEDAAKIARLHSENMAKYKFFSHAGLDGTMVNDRADLLGVRKWKAIGENIAFSRGYKDPVEFTVEGWMNSPKHRDNILNNRWKESAVGVAVSPDGTIYFTQVFILRR